LTWALSVNTLKWIKPSWPLSRSPSVITSSSYFESLSVYWALRTISLPSSSQSWWYPLKTA
jgi:hypothetical protein